MELRLEVTQRISYVMYHNGIDVLLKAEASNIAEAGAEIDFVLRSEPSFFKESRCTASSRQIGVPIDLVGDGRLSMDLDPNYILDLTERMPAKVILEAVDPDGNVLGSAESKVHVLPFDDWPGVDYPETLAAFVTPNSESIVKVTSMASDILREWGFDSSLSGYQGSRDHVLRIGSAVFAALERLDINYINPPAGFEEHGQRIRMADDVIRTRQGTCIDLSVLYASVLESIGINTLLFVTGGHTFAGFWLVNSWLPQIQEFDSSAITRRVRGKDMVAVECTRFVNAFESGFETACERALAKLDDSENFIYALDVKRARAIVPPLPTKRDPSGRVVVDRGKRDVPSSAPSSVGEVYEDDGSNARLSREDKWSRELLDITCRNNLVCMKTGSKVTPLLIDDISGFEDRLSEGHQFQLLSKTQEWDGSQLYSERPFETERYVGNYRTLAASEMGKKMVRTPMAEGETERTLRSIHRNATKEIEESGCSSLFVTLGVLRWYEEKDEVPKYAPLILIPVDMVKSQKGFAIKRRDEEAIFNVTIIEKLRQDFEIPMPSMDPLPLDDSGINVDRIMQTVRQRVYGREGWEVFNAAALGVFSFSQYVMWNDLGKNMGRFRENPLVKCLSDNLPFPGEKNMDVDCDPQGLCLTVPADGSQIRAVRALGEGRSFVMHGPPGTGKSQTITNMICNELYNGRTVLFVAEKLAALEVVHNRLKEVGIANHCLEMHSNKTEKGKVISQLADSLERAKQFDPTELDRSAAEMSRVKSKLDAYVSALHEQRSWGLSAFDCISRYESFDCKDSMDLPFPVGTVKALEGAGASEVEDAVRSAYRAHRLVSDIDDPIMGRIRLSSTAASVNDDVRVVLASMRGAARGLDAVRAEMASAGYPIDSSTAESARAFFDELYSLDAKLASDPRLDEMAGIVRLIFGNMRILEEEVSKWTSPFTISEQKAAYIRGLCGRTDPSLRELVGKGLLASGNPFSSAIEKLRSMEAKASQLSDRLPIVMSSWKPEVFSVGMELNLVQDWNRAKSAGFFSKKKARSEFMSKFSKILLNPECRFEELEMSVSILSSIGFEAHAACGLLSGCKRSMMMEFPQALENLSRISESVESICAFANRHGIDPGRIEEMSKGAKTVEHLVEKLGSAISAADSAIAVFRDATAYDGAIDRNACGEVCDSLEANINRMYDWANRNACFENLESMHLSDVIGAIESGAEEDAILSSVFRSMYRTMINMCKEESEHLRLFNVDSFEKMVRRFKDLDSTCTRLNRGLLKYKLYSNVPMDHDIPGSEVSTLYKAINASRMRKSIRTLLSEIPTVLPKICPCLLMSPLSVAQYITMDYPLFDTVIFDESSQMTTSKAIGSLGRARNAVIAGDHNQLPPTTFFQKRSEIDDDDMIDIDSFLEEARSTNMAETYLEWHYRSRHESLIMFSNRMFYDNKMLTFPSANDMETRVSYRRVHGNYMRGKGVNSEEASAVVDEICRRATDPVLSESSIGVIALSVSQQGCIQDMLDDRLKNDSRLFKAFNGMPEGVFIKNLETVQGDERDVILFSIGYGPDRRGAVYQNFGPINMSGGGKRLNVAASRARSEMVVFSSLDSKDVKITPTSSKGIRGLKEFLWFAESGGRFEDAERDRPAPGCSSVMTSIARELLDRGYGVHFDVGSSEFKVDIAVFDPENRGRYLLGILGDGDSYRASLNTRDREYARPDVLGRLGWRLVHVWSVEWHYQREKVMAKIIDALERAGGDDDAAEHVAEAVPEEAEAVAPSREEPESVPLPPEAQKPSRRIERVWLYPEAAEQLPDEVVYHATFIRNTVTEIVDAESPVNEDMLLHLFKLKTGIKRLPSERRSQLIYMFRKAVEPSIKGEHVTYWAGGEEDAGYGFYRVAPEGEAARDVAFVPFVEMVNACIDVLEKSITIEEEEMVSAVARVMGYARAGTNVRKRVSEAVDSMVEDGIAELSNGRYRLAEQ